MSDQENTQPRVAVVGCGGWGKNLVRNFAELGALAAVVDPNPETAQSFAQTYDCRNLSFDEALAADDIQGIVIAAPAELHHRLGKAALLAGKDVYVEKPIALELDDATELCALAEKTGQRLMVGHLLQYHPVFIKARETVEAGTLGRLQYVYSNRLSLGKIRREEDVMWSFAPHDLSMVLSLIGEEPSDVEASGSYFLHDKIADVSTVQMRFPSGKTAQVFTSWLHPFKEQKLVVVGDKGMLVFDDTLPWAEKLKLYPHQVDWKNGVPAPVKADAVLIEVEQSEPLRQECQHFLDCISTAATPRTDGREGLRVLRVLARASEAMQRNRPTPAPEAAPKAPPHPGVTIHESAYVDDGVSIGKGTKIWHFSHVLGDVTIGENCNLGQNVVVGPRVSVGNRVKIQNNVSVYNGVVLEDGVFCGPSCVFTNVNNPRAEIERKSEYLETRVKRGTTIGANATIVCGHTLGEYSFIAAGAVVASDVPAFALMAGVPARRIGWMSQAGGKLGPDLVCPIDGTAYVEQGPDTLLPIDK